MINSASARTACAMIGLLITGHATAISIVGDNGGASYSDARHDRWYEGSDKDFIGASLDLSGVSRSQVGTQRLWLTLISDSYFIATAHRIPPLNANITFHREDSLSSETWVVEAESGTQLGTSDLWIGKFEEPAPAWVRRYPLLKRPKTLDFTGIPGAVLDLFVVGRPHAPNSRGTADSVRVGKSRIDGFSDNANPANTSIHTDGFHLSDPSVFPDDGVRTAGGDSGGPTFVEHPTAGSALAGIHSAYDLDTSIWQYIDEITAAVPEPITVVTDQPGDANADYTVNFQDAAALSGGYQATDPTYSQGDFNLDGIVNFQDAAVLSAHYGESFAAPADFNGDYFIDGSDFGVIASSWLQAVTPGTQGDVNADGVVDRNDVLQFDAVWDVRFAQKPTAVVQIAGDANFDGTVNFADQVLIGDNFGMSVPPYTMGDVNGDELVNFQDSAIVSANLDSHFADATGDSYVDLDDVDVVTSNWQTSTMDGRADGDINDDGFVDGADLAIIGDWWRFKATGIGDFTESAIPEPNAGLLMLAALTVASPSQRSGRGPLAG